MTDQQLSRIRSIAAQQGCSIQEIVDLWADYAYPAADLDLALDALIADILEA